MTFSEMVRPLTINHDASLVYVNVNDLMGFEIGDILTFQDCKLLETNTQFAVGDPKAYAARVAAGSR